VLFWSAFSDAIGLIKLTSCFFPIALAEVIARTHFVDSHKGRVARKQTVSRKVSKYSKHEAQIHINYNDENKELV